MKLGILCTSEGLELAALIAAAESGRLAGEIKIVIADRDSEALALAREAGLYGVFVPRAPFHANRDGFERRLAEVFFQAGAEAVVLAGYQRELGDVLLTEFSGRVYGQGLGPEELTADLEKRLRADRLSLV